MKYLHKLDKDDTTLKEYGVTIPEWGIVVLENAAITPSNAVYTVAGRIDCSLDTIERWKKKVNFFVARELFSFLRRSKKRYKDVFYISDIFQANYYHWFCEILPRILFFHTKFPTKEIVLSEQLKKHQFVLDSLSHYQIKPTWIKPSHGALVRKLHLIITRPNKREPHPFVLDLMRGKDKSDSARENLIYISRKKAMRRRLINEDEIFDILRIVGFRKFFLEEMSFDEQKKLFSEAKVIVAPHGAGLTNMIFSPKGVDIIELLSGESTNPKVYRDLALLCGHRYKAIIGSSTEDNFSDFSVDTEVFKKEFRFLSQSV